MLKLSIQNLSKSYQNLKVLENISLTLKKGEFVSIIGPSGCGKSTLFNIIAGVEKQSIGEIWIDGRNFSDRAGKIGYMSQNPTLLPWRNVLENIVLGLDIKKQQRSKSEKMAFDLLRKFELDVFARSYPATLSGGMKQRVALLRTVLFHSEFMLLDEPFGALDGLTRLTLQLWLNKVWTEIGASILFITHDISEAMLLSDRIYVFSALPGKILEEVIVDLPRPRKPQHLSGRKGASLENKLLKLLFNGQEL